MPNVKSPNNYKAFWWFKAMEIKQMTVEKNSLRKPPLGNGMVLFENYFNHNCTSFNIFFKEVYEIYYFGESNSNTLVQIPFAMHNVNGNVLLTAEDL